MMWPILRLFNYTQNTDEQAIYENPLARTDTSKRISMHQLLRWTRYACLCTNASTRSGPPCIRLKIMAPWKIPSWRNEGCHIKSEPFRSLSLSLRIMIDMTGVWHICYNNILRLHPYHLHLLSSCSQLRWLNLNDTWVIWRVTRFIGSRKPLTRPSGTTLAGVDNKVDKYGRK